MAKEAAIAMAILEKDPEKVRNNMVEHLDDLDGRIQPPKKMAELEQKAL